MEREAILFAITASATVVMMALLMRWEVRRLRKWQDRYGLQVACAMLMTCGAALASGGLWLL